MGADILPDAELALLVDAVHQAAAVATGYFTGDNPVWEKDDGSPVSQADLATDAKLAEVLRGARPQYGWLSEESDSHVGATRTFVVDPIDGTKAYLRGETAWCVAAAVIEEGRPLAAAIFRPLSQTLFTAEAGSGAMRNGEAIAVSQRTALSGATVAMPGQLFREAGYREAGVKKAGQIPSLALRLAKVASGRLDGVITRSGPHHWDLAAADLIVQEAGGVLTTLSGTPPRYDTMGTHHSPIVAGPPRLAAALREQAAAFTADAVSG